MKNSYSYRYVVACTSLLATSRHKNAKYIVSLMVESERLQAAWRINMGMKRRSTATPQHDEETTVHKQKRDDS
eukprot:scaffold281389_cov31-Tisochrysis_lutea.AAC.2